MRLAALRYKRTAKGKATRDRYNHSEKGRATRSRWQKTDKGRALSHFSCAKRRIKTGEKNSAILKIYHRAQQLRQWFEVVVDHIIPLAKGGAHAAANLQIIYAYENQRKGDRLKYEPAVIFT
jgi:5-methylcytosine-specific restriction endonuclease McrA